MHAEASPSRRESSSRAPLPPVSLISQKASNIKKEHFVSRVALKCYSAWLCQTRTVKESSLYLFGQQLFAQCVKCDKLPRQHPRVYEALGHQHDFTDQLEVWYHHGARPVGGGGYKKERKKKKSKVLRCHSFLSGADM